MSFSLVTFLTFTTLLLAISGSGFELHWVAARIIIFLSLLAGVIAHWLSTSKTRLSPQDYISKPIELKAKIVAVRLLLVMLLAFSTLMSKVFSNWPGATFNLDFFLVLPLILLWGVPWYVCRAEAILPAGYDGYARFGQCVLGERKWRWAEQRELVLAWLVKLIFIPMMYSWLVMTTEGLLAFNWSLHPVVVVGGFYTYGLAADLLIATSGYLFSTRLLGSAVISTDKTWSGWFVCLLCYPPLIWIYQLVKKQTNDLVWSDWLEPDQLLFWFWAAAITLTWLVYWLSTFHFGLRFANLSWRGLVNTGPYRWVKHPAYLSKNLYWWLYLVPFYGVATSYDLIRNIFGLSFVSLVYYLRAYTEERHLMRFSEYQAYVIYIREFGLVARLKFWFYLYAKK